MAEVIGTDYRMRDANDRVLGTIPMVLDHTMPGMAHAVAVRCPHAHARIIAIDTSDAVAAPGVLTTLTGADLDADPGVDPWFGAQRADQPVLCIGKARYDGDPVALVVAETVAQARDAALLVDVDYEVLPYVVDEVAAVADGAPTVHDDHPDNICGSWRLRHGEVERGLAEADRVYEAVYHSPPASHVPMEPHVAVAHWVEGRCEVWSSAQAPHAVRTGLETMFALEPGSAVVRTLNLGGAYGAKGQIKIEPMVACAARTAGRPVRMELARDEVFQTVGKHAATVEISTGAMLDGTITTRRVRVTYNAGAYTGTSHGAAGQGLTRAPGPYRLQHCAVDSISTFTNTVPSGPFRGAMTSQLAFAYESQLDDIAADLGIDPVELRRRNLLRDGDEYATGEALHDLHYDELLDDLAAGIGWGREPAPAPAGRVRGRGLGIIIKNTLTPSRSEAGLRLGRDGRVGVLSSSVEMGQGAGATMLQLTADYLGVSPDRLDMVLPDTSVTPFDTTTSSSRSTSSMGAALRAAADDLLRQLGDLAAGQFGTDSASMQHDDGHVGPGERPDEARPWGKVIADAGLDEITGEGVFASDFGLRYMDPHDVHGPVSVHWHQGGAAAEVEVDLETGRVELLALHANCFAGRVVSPLRVRQQNQGCAVYGLGPTLFEELDYHDGSLSNPNLSDYMIPSIVDVPEQLTTAAVEAPGADAEMHGVGEMALPGVAPAVANAVFAATGIRVTRLPLTPERVLRAIHDTEGQR